MTVADLITEWFESKKLDRLMVNKTNHRNIIQYTHTRLLDAGNGTTNPEWIFYEIMYIEGFEVVVYNEERETLNVHKPDFFEKFEEAIYKQIKRIENHTSECRIAGRSRFVFGGSDFTSNTHQTYTSGASDSLFNEF